MLKKLTNKQTYFLRHSDGLCFHLYKNFKQKLPFQKARFWICYNVRQPKEKFRKFISEGSVFLTSLSFSQFSCSVMSVSKSDPMDCSTLGFSVPTTPGAHSNSCPSSWWCHPAISCSVISFSSCLQSFPASGSFPMSPVIASGVQSIVASATASVLPMNIQDWLPLGLNGFISLLSKGLPRVFSNTTVWRH